MQVKVEMPSMNHYFILKKNLFFKENIMNKVTTIALTGGPCGGKSTSISFLYQKLSDKGYQVFVVEEMATNLILSGAAPDKITNWEFQKMLVKLQYNRNKVYSEMAEKFSKLHNKPVVIIYDRGIPDGKGFMQEDEYSKLLKELGYSEMKILDYYDGVFHLVTAADGAPEAYTLDNNEARSETPEQAIERDRSCLKAWTGHNHLRVIDNVNKTFEQKLNHLLEEVYALLGIPVPIEIERKYLIEMPDMEKLNKRYDCTTVNILQTYLVRRNKNIERRIRQRGANGEYTYYYTEKELIDTGLSRIEREKKISQDEYLKLMIEADTTLHQIMKKRTCFVYKGTYFELDSYGFWDDKAILEVELTNESESVELPKGIKLIKEVTNDSRYKNASLALNCGKID